MCSTPPTHGYYLDPGASCEWGCDAGWARYDLDSKASMCVRPLLIPNPELLPCMLNATWSDIVGDTAEEVYSQGGLGKLMERDVVENWVCAKDHPCSTGTSLGATTNSLNDEMCFFFAERYSTFLPWGRRSQVLSLK
eukprot:1358470-Rhodomonas_salina.1